MKEKQLQMNTICAQLNHNHTSTSIITEKQSDVSRMISTDHIDDHFQLLTFLSLSLNTNLHTWNIIYTTITS